MYSAILYLFLFFFIFFIFFRPPPEHFKCQDYFSGLEISVNFVKDGWVRCNASMPRIEVVRQNNDCIAEIRAIQIQHVRVA